MMYEKLDQAIIDNIKRFDRAKLDYCRSFNAQVDADRIAKETGRDSFRVVDGRLTALKKRGVIHYSEGKWRMK